MRWLSVWSARRGAFSRPLEGRSLRSDGAGRPEELARDRGHAGLWSFCERQLHALRAVPTGAGAAQSSCNHCMSRPTQSTGDERGHALPSPSPSICPGAVRRHRAPPESSARPPVLSSKLHTSYYARRQRARQQRLVDQRRWSPSAERGSEVLGRTDALGVGKADSKKAFRRAAKLAKK